MKFIPVNEPVVTEEDKELVIKALNDGWISSEGPYIKEFEDSFKSYFGVKDAIACSSGSAALDLVFASLGVGEGDEVIVPDFTIISCASAVVRTGAVPVFVDANSDDWNMDTTLLENAVTKKTKAILVVHIYGLPTNMACVMEVAKKYGLLVIEDCAEYLGGRFRQQLTGTIGDVSIFSFYPNKNVTTGEGGMVITNSREIAEKCKWYRNLCFEPNKRFVHEEIGWNYRMSSLQAALGISQMRRLNETIELKRVIGMRYWERFKDSAEVTIAPESTDDAVNQYWVFGIVLRGEGISATEVMAELGSKGIGTRPFFYPMSLQPVFVSRGIGERRCVGMVGKELYEKGFYIPSGLGLTEEEQGYISDTVLEVVQKRVS